MNPIAPMLTEVLDEIYKPSTGFKTGTKQLMKTGEQLVDSEILASITIVSQLHHATEVGGIIKAKFRFTILPEVEMEEDYIIVYKGKRYKAKEVKKRTYYTKGILEDIN